MEYFILVRLLRWLCTIIDCLTILFKVLQDIKNIMSIFYDDNKI